jgi:hypothetical protein
MNTIKLLVVINLLLLVYVIALVVMSIFDVSIANLRIHFSVHFNYYYLVFIGTSLLAFIVRAADKKSKIVVWGSSIAGLLILFICHSIIQPW